MKFFISYIKDGVRTAVERDQRGRLWLSGVLLFGLVVQILVLPLDLWRWWRRI